VVDHTKWGRVALSTFCPIDRIGLIITDAQAPGAVVAEMRARGIEVQLVEAGGAGTTGRQPGWSSTLV
jgi:DeoR/GlpR family transcriptional regulator of sugar metabolism